MIRQVIFMGRQVPGAPPVIQALYRQKGNFVCETVKDIPGRKIKAASIRVITRREAYALARENYIDRIIDYSERGLLQDPAYQQALDLLHKSAMHIGAES